MPYDPHIDGTLVRTLADWGAFFDKNGKPNDIIELVDQENSILDDILFQEASDDEFHKTTVRAGLPQVYWGRLYKGTPVSKSDVSTIKDPLGMLEARALIDSRLLRKYGANARAYRFSEAQTFMEAMRQELSTALFYGDIKTNPDGLHGLSPRYIYKDAPHVIDAGGTGSNLTSMWGVVWGANEVTGLFPRNSSAGLRHEDLGESDVTDADNNEFRVAKDLYEWWVGFSVRDWRCVVRICDIDTTKLHLNKGDTGFVDLQRLTIRAKNLIPPAKRTRLKWYCNQDVLTGLELQSTDSGYVHLAYGDLYRSKNIAMLHGAPVRQDDAILSTEDALGSTP